MNELQGWTIQEAATIVLMRERKKERYGSQLEVYMTKRPSTMRFLANHYVYPGGQVDDGDHAPEWASLCAQIPSGQNPEGLGLAYWVAALRETFEEAGVLLARDANGQLVPQVQALVWREELLANRVSFAELIGSNGWMLATDRLRYFGHRLTPRKVSSKRFSTRFFLTILPEGVEPSPHAGEVEEAAWYDASTALRKWARGEMLMVPPTVDSLRVVGCHRQALDLWNSVDGVGTPTAEELE